jgi:hypothetical protein
MSRIGLSESIETFDRGIRLAGCPDLSDDSLDAGFRPWSNTDSVDS